MTATQFSEFTLFPSLPQELQDKIWSFALTAATPRVHSLDVYPKTGSILIVKTASLSQSTLPSRQLAAACHASRKAVYRGLPHEVHLKYDENFHTNVRFRMDAKQDVLLLKGLDARVMDFFNTAVNGEALRIQETSLDDPIDNRPDDENDDDSDQMDLGMSDDDINGSSNPKQQGHDSREEEEVSKNIHGLVRLGLPIELTLVAISVPDDFYYRAFNVWPLGWSDGATNVLRKFILTFPNLETLFLKASFPILASGIAQARAMIKDLSDPEWKSSTENLDWIRGTASGYVPPWLSDRSSSFVEPAGSGNGRRSAGGGGGVWGIWGTSSGNGSDPGTSGGGGVPNEEGKDWFLAAKPYHSWGSGIPALSNVRDANLWRQARLRKVMGGNDDNMGMKGKDVERLEKVDVSMLLWLEW
ncbi:hypothetical protein MKZ38_004564 [Zalerion maritima]|uniref:2EXR domain-containing protein n=1 Tax=Zalerion maritima TaxID=339359 RepID=A0AAD5WWD5_9PEZI|nr:hypothetical protein MKZ38_004564 [Zalerion maritima]